ncbi:hypothetical protein WJX84_000930 [Apatococcus fuscideae]|uniref:Uncharacterized protein n=1 Tax=Apatococcus fuscideae TaxID=2026836 RepID=A0AAW1SYR4_9CHLO
MFRLWFPSREEVQRDMDQGLGVYLERKRELQQAVDLDTGALWATTVQGLLPPSLHMEAVANGTDICMVVREYCKSHHNLREGLPQSCNRLQKPGVVGMACEAHSEAVPGTEEYLVIRYDMDDDIELHTLVKTTSGDVVDLAQTMSVRKVAAMELQVHATPLEARVLVSLISGG